ncbi:MAG: hypothetical protein ACI8ZX_001109 [Planctomycetota bacterium]|jgi:hypothetical protein
MLILMYSLWKNNKYYDAEHEIKKAAEKKIPAALDNFKIECEIS